MSQKSNGTEQGRIDFSKIHTELPIPNLIEVQKQSYNRFLQMHLLAQEREDGGLQAVFNSVFPITDFRGVSQLDFVDYSIGNWECKCGNLKGLHHLRTTCARCGASVITSPYNVGGEILCGKCGSPNRNRVTFCDKCGDPVDLQLKYDVVECQERGMTYAAPLKVTIRLTIYEKDPETGGKTIRDIKEQEVFFGEIPLMTENGTFIVNGTERVIVSQLHRSPGVFFETANQRTYFLGKIIPYRGSWVEFEYDSKNLLYVRIDRKRKFLGSVFLRALGLRSDADILQKFYKGETLRTQDKRIFWELSEGMIGLKLSHHILHPKTKEEMVHAGRRITSTHYDSLKKAHVEVVEVLQVDLEGAHLLADVVDTGTGEVLAEANTPLTPERLAAIAEAGIPQLRVFFPEREEIGVVLSQTLKKDSLKTPEEALIEIYRKLRPGDPPTLDTAVALFQGMFLDPRKYDFSRVGRLKSNIKLDKNIPLDVQMLKSENRGWVKFLNLDGYKFQDYIFVKNTDEGGFITIADGAGHERERHPVVYGDRVKVVNGKEVEGGTVLLERDSRQLKLEDFAAVLQYLFKLRRNIGTVDDIDHLGNRRVRAVGELLENQFRIGLVRMERAIKEKMSVYQEMSTAMPHDLVNAKPAMAAIREFFGSSQLSQFMDQTNPLAELTHKRRLSALGPGGLSRERAGFDVRDVHFSHYGRICPIETPEGPNIGLLSSLASFARINAFGFIESPYRKVFKELPNSDQDLTGRNVTQDIMDKEDKRIVKEGSKITPAAFKKIASLSKRAIPVRAFVSSKGQDILYLSADKEGVHIVAQANVELDDKNQLVGERVEVRVGDRYAEESPDRVDFMDVSPMQIMSVSASLIPFFLPTW